MSALKTQIAGNHYTKLAIQPMEYSMANNLDACQHTIIKYVTRFRDKAGIQDLRKAIHVIEMLIEFEEAAAKTGNSADAEAKTAKDQAFADVTKAVSSLTKAFKAAGEERFGKRTNAESDASSKTIGQMLCSHPDEDQVALGAAVHCMKCGHTEK
jgi:hypothetical protein